MIADFDEELHYSQQPVKIDAMFFSASEETAVLLGQGALESKLLDDMEKNQLTSRIDLEIQPKYLEYDTVIMCNPNAMTYQSMINYPHAYYLKYFLNKQINCLVWNYRGYGRTRGQLKPHHLKTDAEQVLNFLKLRIGVKGKIAVYGRSLGCVAVCYLQEQVDFALADRGFGDLWTLAERKFHSILATPILKSTTFGWQAHNSFNFLKKNKKPGKRTYKVIIQDHADEIIDINCSLMVGVANEVCRVQSSLMK